MFDLPSRVPADVAGRCVLCDEPTPDELLNGYGECPECSDSLGDEDDWISCDCSCHCDVCDTDDDDFGEAEAERESGLWG